MKKKILLILFCFVFVCSAAGCAQSADEPEEKTSPDLVSAPAWPIDDEGNGAIYFDVEEGEYHVTSAVLIENGKARALTKEEYLKLAGENYSQSFKAEPAETEKFTASGIEKQYDVQSLSRISALYDKVTSVGILFSESFNSRISANGQKKLTDEQKQAVDELLCSVYKVKQKAASFEQETAMFASGNYQFSAVAFIPCMEVIQGTYHDEEDIEITAGYPYVDESGFLDGIVLMLEAGSKEALGKL